MSDVLEKTINGNKIETKYAKTVSNIACIFEGEYRVVATAEDGVEQEWDPRMSIQLVIISFVKRRMIQMSMLISIRQDVLQQ